MFKIRQEQFVLMRRKKIGDALIERLAPVTSLVRWDSEQRAILLDDALGYRSRISFDSLGFMDRFTSPLGRTWQLSNTSDGKLLQISSPSGHKVGMDYGPDGTIASIASSSSQQVWLNYTPQRSLAAATFADNTRVSIDYTSWNAPARVTDRQGFETLLRYDDHRRLTSITDGNGNSTEFEYGRWNRPDATRFPNGTRESYTYDGDGRVSGIRQGDVAIVTKCSEKGRPLLLHYSDGTKIEYEYNARGQVIRATLGDLQTSVVWNESGQVKEELTGGDSHKFTYDAAGRLTGIEGEAGQSVGYQWDADSRLVGFVDWNGGKHVIEYTSGDRGSVVSGSNGIRTSIALQSGGKVESVNIGDRGGSLLSLAYTYDQDERVSTQRDSIFGDRAFSYDADGRILSVDGVVRESFSYDRAGNLTRINGLSAQHDSANQLMAVGQTELRYDTRGNLTSRRSHAGIWTFAYNARNQMTSSTSPAGVQTIYAYDAFGRRTRKRTGSRETRFIWEGERLVGETLTDLVSGSLTHQDYLYHPESGAPLATRIDGKVFSYHTDHLGTPRALTSPEGKVVWLAEAAMYGQTSVAVEEVRNSLRFPGQYFDEETGFHYNRFRYYSPEWGRYITRDPMSFCAGPNAYLYADCDPGNTIDPNGLFTKTDAFWTTVTAIVVVAVVTVVLMPATITVGIALAAGAIGGAVVGGVAAAANSEAANGHVVWPCVIKGTVIGGIFGAAAAGVGLAVGALGLSAGAAFGARSAGGAVVGAANYGANVLSDPNAHFEWSGLGIYMAASAVSTGVSGAKLVAVPDEEADLFTYQAINASRNAAVTLNHTIDAGAGSLNSLADIKADSLGGPSEDFDGGAGDGTENASVGSANPQSGFGQQGDSSNSCNMEDDGAGAPQG